MSRRSPWRRVLDDLCADGKRHDTEEVLTAMRYAVPSHVAIRARRREREHQRQFHQDEGPAPLSQGGDVPLAHEIRVGARFIARRTLREAVAYGNYEEKDGTIRQTRRPRQP